MSKERKVLEFYVLCNRLKNVIRTGWKDWHVSADRLESVAEHIYSTQMLAIAIKYEYNYDIDLYKVIYMIAIHEIGENVIGDITIFDMPKEEKRRIEREAVLKIFKSFTNMEYVKELYFEFEKGETKEAKYAKHCDKLDCTLQAKLYDEQGSVDLNNQEDNKSFHDEEVQKLLKENNNSWSVMMLKLWQNKCDYDDNFNKIIDYACDNKISDLSNYLIKKL